MENSEEAVASSASMVVTPLMPYWIVTKKSCICYFYPCNIIIMTLLEKFSSIVNTKKMVGFKAKSCYVSLPYSLFLSSSGISSMHPIKKEIAT